MWKRVRFWGGMVLVVVVGIALLFWHSYRKSLGPPPTPPGKSPEFDQHLAEIDKDWLFVFNDGGKIIVTDIYGGGDRELAIPKSGTGAGILDPVVRVSAFPGGRWAAICYVVKDPSTKHWPRLLMVLVDLRDYSMKIITPDEALYHGADYSPWWFDEKTFLLPLRRQGSFAQSYPGPEHTTACFLYDIDDLEHPETVEFPVNPLWLLRPGHFASDYVSNALLFLSEPDDSGNKVLKACDKNGLRDITREEEDRYDMLATMGKWFNRGGGWDVPAFETKELERPAWPDWLFSRLRKRVSRRSEITLNGTRVRLATYPDASSEAIWFLAWEWDISLFTWREFKSEDEVESYYMDKKGRYRFI